MITDVELKKICKGRKENRGHNAVLVYITEKFIINTNDT